MSSVLSSVSSAKRQAASPLCPPPSALHIYRGDETEHAATTLCEFAERWFFPKKLLARNPPANPKTVAGYKTALRLWSELVGDPPLQEVTPDTCARYVELLRERPGRDADCLSATTVDNHRASVENLLMHAGPAGQGCRRPAEIDGLFGRDEYGRPRPAPWFPETSRRKTLPRECLSTEQILALIAATRKATQPSIDGVEAPAWWTAIYRWSFWTGIRIGSTLAARADWIRQSGNLVWIEIPGQFYKGGRPEAIWLHPRALAAIQGLPAVTWTASADPRLFPWPHTFKHLETVHTKNLIAAGLLPLRDFKLHTFRRAIASELYGIKVAAAGLHVRHAGGVTVESYVQVKARVAGHRAVIKPALDRVARKFPEL